MGLFDKLFGKSESQKTKAKDHRKAPRKNTKEFFKIQFTIKGKKFRIHDFSSAGIGLIDEGNSELELGKIYTAEMVAHGKARGKLKIKVVRMSNDSIGCEILDQAAFKSFETDFLT